MCFVMFDTFYAPKQKMSMCGQKKSEIEDEKEERKLDTVLAVIDL